MEHGAGACTNFVNFLSSILASDSDFRPPISVCFFPMHDDRQPVAFQAKLLAVIPS